MFGTAFLTMGEALIACCSRCSCAALVSIMVLISFVTDMLLPVAPALPSSRKLLTANTMSAHSNIMHATKMANLLYDILYLRLLVLLFILAFRLLLALVYSGQQSPVHSVQSFVGEFRDLPFAPARYKLERNCSCLIFLSQFRIFFAQNTDRIFVSAVSDVLPPFKA